MATGNVNESHFPGATGGKFILVVVDEETVLRASRRSNYALTVTDVPEGASVEISTTQDTSYPDHLLELLYDQNVFSPKGVQPGTSISQEQHLFLAVTSQPGRIPLGIARIGGKRASEQIVPAGSVLATASFTRQPFSPSQTSLKAASLAVAGGLYQLHATLNDDGILTSWQGEHPGDYNIDGNVSIADITPLAIHYGTEPRMGADGFPIAIGENEFIYHIDTSGNGVVDIADITAIAMHYGSVIAGYRVYRGVCNEEDEPVWDDFFLANPADPSAPFTVPFGTSRLAGEFQTYSYQMITENPGDASSLWVRVSPTDGEIDGEGIELQVFLSVPHEPFACEVCHNEDMTFKGIELSCLICHFAPPEDTDREWAEASPSHAMCLNCHQAHEFRVIPPEQVCGNCHGALTDEICGTGMEACLDCHEAPHLPVTQPNTTSCSTCHTAIAEIVSASKSIGCFECHESHSWTANQDSCSICHDEAAVQASGSLMRDCGWCHADHDFSSASAFAGCEQCHAEELSKIGGTSMPTCTMCHQGHWWKANADICQDCHAAQAEEVSQGLMTGCNWCHADHEFTSASALTGCQQCHTEEQAKIGGTLMPTCDICHEGHLWEADTGICQDCHATQADEVSQGLMTGCDWCHADHAFDSVLAQTLCTECHTTPPEDPSASWDSAPGTHGQCSSCHQSHVFGLSGVDTDDLCGTCHSEVVEPTQAAGMASCVSCHQFPHLPMQQLTLNSCGDCHDAIAANLAGSSKEDCFLCHEAHVWQGSSSVCASCHGVVAQELSGSGMTDCALCHDDHEYDSSGLFDNCSSCHPRPLPALHEVKKHKNTDCYDCHSAHYFSLTGREPCLSCHKNRNNHNLGTACAECHSFTD